MTTMTGPTTTSDRSSRTDRSFPAATGGAFAVLVVVGNGIYTEGGGATLGYAVELLGYVALAVFVSWIALSFDAVHRGATMLAVVGGATMLAVKLGGWTAARASLEESLAAEVSAGLAQVDEVAFVLGWLPYGLLMIGLSLAAGRAGRLPRPMVWVGIAAGLGCVLAVPVSTSEPFVLPWLFSLLWLIAASILLARGRRRGDREWSVEV